MTDEETIELMLEIFTGVIGEVDKVTADAEVPMAREDDRWKINGEVIIDYTSDFDL